MEVFLQQSANALVLGAAYILVTVGLFLVFSVLGIPNFAHGEMFAIGAYIQYTLVVILKFPFFPSILLSMLAVGLLGIALERTIFRRLTSVNLLSTLIGSLALAIIMQETIRVLWGGSPVSVPSPVDGVIELGSVRIAIYRLIVVALVLVACAAVGWMVYRTGFGRKLRALTQNRDLAEFTGVNVASVGILTFGLGSALAGLAGALLSATGALNPYMGFHPTLVAFVILTVVGSGGRLSAVLIGGMAVAIIETLTAGYVSNALRSGVVFVVLVIFLTWRPEGAVKRAGVERGQL